MNPNLPLREIHLPDAAGWWPPAPGWWLLLVLIPVCLYGLYYLYRRITRKTAVKQAQKELQRIRQMSEQTPYEQLCALSQLLRRAAISVYPRVETAALTGEQWLNLLDRQLSDQPFSRGIGRLFSEAPYQPSGVQELPIDELYVLAGRCLQAMKKVPK